MSYEREQARSEERIARVPFSGPRLRLQLSDQDRKAFDKRGMVPRWFNDQDGRVAQAEGAGYKFVDPRYAQSLGSGAVHANTDLGPRVSTVVSKGEPVITAYLMEIKKEFYDEDQAAKEAVNAQVDEALALGGAQASDLENEYKPK